jgi:hypothetical protein
MLRDKITEVSVKVDDFCNEFVIKPKIRNSVFCPMSLTRLSDESYTTIGVVRPDKKMLKSNIFVISALENPNAEFGLKEMSFLFYRHHNSSHKHKSVFDKSIFSCKHRVWVA